MLEKAENLGEFFFSMIQISERKNVNTLTITLQEIQFSEIQFTPNLLVLEQSKYDPVDQPGNG